MSCVCFIPDPVIKYYIWRQRSQLLQHVGLTCNLAKKCRSVPHRMSVVTLKCVHVMGRIGKNRVSVCVCDQTEEHLRHRTLADSNWKKSGVEENLMYESKCLWESKCCVFIGLQTIISQKELWRNLGCSFNLEISENISLRITLPNKGYNSSLNQRWHVTVKFAKTRIWE